MIECIECMEMGYVLLCGCPTDNLFILCGCIVCIIYLEKITVHPWISLHLLLLSEGHRLFFFHPFQKSIFIVCWIINHQISNKIYTHVWQWENKDLFGWLTCICWRWRRSWKNVYKKSMLCLEPFLKIFKSKPSRKFCEKSVL